MEGQWKVKLQFILCMTYKSESHPDDTEEKGTKQVDDYLIVKKILTG